MFSRMHSKLGTAGLIVAVVALVAALTGAAFAAGGLTKQQENQVTKIAKKYAGKQGAAGPQGLPGGNGTNGANGKDGAAGSPGAAGKGVVLGTAGVECPTGGTTVQVEGSATKKSVCNGEKGGFSEVMPSGTTSTGAWSMGTGSPDVEKLLFSVSFPMRYPGPTPPSLVFVKEEGEESDKCPGTAAKPDAKPGFLCFYVAVASNENYSYNEPYSTLFNLTTNGATLVVSQNATEVEGTFHMLIIMGTWAVTAP